MKNHDYKEEKRNEKRDKRQKSVTQAIIERKGKELQVYGRERPIVRRSKKLKKISSCLSDRNYIELVKRVIQRVRLEFSDCSSQIVWDIAKIQIREASIAYSKNKSRERNKKNRMLELQLKEVEHKLSSDPNNDELLQKLQDTKLAIDLLSLYSAQGAQTRSRVKWIEEGEKNSKFFQGWKKQVRIIN